jgi:hypothetical protein
MKFMFIIFHDEKTLDALPEPEKQTLVDSALDYMDDLRRSGHFIVSNALQRGRTARTIHVRGGKVTITDGPFAETKEQIGGFFLIIAAAPMHYETRPPAASGPDGTTDSKPEEAARRPPRSPRAPSRSPETAPA